MQAVPGVGLSDLPERLDALAELVRIGSARGLSPELMTEGEAVLRRAGERLRMSSTHTVVAIAGGTGSGKSSLFNALAGASFSPAGVTRPTTRDVHACVWGMRGAAPLLDWLGVQRRHRYARASALDAGEADLDGLLLLDLPDHDSVVASSLSVVDRTTKQADMLLWVLDPQKYADDAVHSRYLIPLAGHASVTTVLLNQVDVLTEEQAADCEADLRRLLDAEGLEGARLLPVSARTGAGLDDLRNALVRTVAASRAASERIAADIDNVLAGFAEYDTGPAAAADQAGERPAPAAGPGSGSLGKAAGGPVFAGSGADRSWEAPARPPWEDASPDGRDAGAPESDWAAYVPQWPAAELGGAFARAAGITAICDALQGAVEVRSARYVTWPLARLARLGRRNDPVRGLGRAAPGGPRDIAAAAGDPRRSDVDNAITAFADQVSEPLPQPWDQLTREGARSRAREVPGALSAAMRAAVPERDRSPRWWTLALIWQWLLVVLMVAGVAWIGLLVAFHAMHSRSPQMFTDTSLLPWLAIMVVAIGLLGWLTASGSQNMVLLAADHDRDKLEIKLRDQVGIVTRDLVLAPAGYQLAEYDRFRRHLATARGPAATPPAPMSEIS
jgi:energy-coupling factor transporter ATP-binding protein EcfA2